MSAVIQPSAGLGDFISPAVLLPTRIDLRISLLCFARTKPNRVSLCLVGGLFTQMFKRRCENIACFYDHHEALCSVYTERENRWPLVEIFSPLCTADVLSSCVGRWARRQVRGSLIKGSLRQSASDAFSCGVLATEWSWTAALFWVRLALRWDGCLQSAPRRLSRKWLQLRLSVCVGTGMAVRCWCVPGFMKAPRDLNICLHRYAFLLPSQRENSLLHLKTNREQTWATASLFPAEKQLQWNMTALDKIVKYIRGNGAAPSDPGDVGGEVLGRAGFFAQ